MNVEFKCVQLRTLCEGCLSSDRKLKLISDVEIINFFRSILDRFDYSQKPITLCWECIALIKKTLKYKKRVQKAHQLLSQYVLNQSTSIHPLSNLNKTQPSTLDIVPTLSDVASSVKSEKDAQNEVAFIKVESNDDDFVDQFGDTCIEAVSPSVKQCDEFNASDDEPLTKVRLRSDSGVKKRGRPRKGDVDLRQEKSMTKRKDRCGVISNARVENKLRKLNVAPGQLEMVVLSWEEVEEERQKALTSPPFTTLTYKCYHCAIGFSHKFKLDNHMKKHDPSSGPMRCPVCSVHCGHSAAALAAHKRRHRVRWRCVRCGGVWSRASVGADHCARHHAAPPPTHHCPLCTHTYTSLSQLRRHVRSHGDKQECSLCGKLFGDTASLRTHLFIHKGEKEFVCPKCDKRFLFKKAMEIHLETHNESANLYCHECDLNFKNKMSYYQHMKYNLKHIDPAKLNSAPGKALMNVEEFTTGLETSLLRTTGKKLSWHHVHFITQYACHLCDKKFAKASRLNEHNLGVHLKLTPFKCTQQDCTYSFSSRPALRTHVRMIHRNARAHRNHVCHTCGKAYSTKKVLEGHLRAHSGSRPYSCELCAASFTYRGALYNHTRLVHKKKYGVSITDTSSNVPNWHLQLNISNTEEHLVDIT